MVVIEWISVAMQINDNCHIHSRPPRKPPAFGKGESGPHLCQEDPLQHITAFILIHSALAYLKQLIWIGSLPSESLSLLTNKHDDNIASQAVVCYWAARWRRLCDSRITNQCVVTWPAAKVVWGCWGWGRRHQAKADGMKQWHNTARLWQAAPADQGNSNLLAMRGDLANTKCYQIAELCFKNYYNLSPDRIYMSCFFVFLCFLY